MEAKTNLAPSSEEEAKLPLQPSCRPASVGLKAVLLPAPWAEALLRTPGYTT